MYEWWQKYHATYWSNKSTCHENEEVEPTSSDEHLTNEYLQKRPKLAKFRRWAKFKRGRNNLSLHIRFCSLSNHIQAAAKSISPGITSIFLARRKKLHKTNKGSHFLKGSFSNRDWKPLLHIICKTMHMSNNILSN